MDGLHTQNKRNTHLITRINEHTQNKETIVHDYMHQLPYQMLLEKTVWPQFRRLNTFVKNGIVDNGWNELPYKNRPMYGDCKLFNLTEQSWELITDFRYRQACSYNPIRR